MYSKVIIPLSEKGIKNVIAQELRNIPSKDKTTPRRCNPLYDTSVFQNDITHFFSSKNSFSVVGILITIWLHLSKLHFAGEMIFLEEVSSIPSLFPHLLAYHTRRKTISSVLEKPVVATMYSIQRAPEGVRHISYSSMLSAGCPLLGHGSHHNGRWL